MRPTLVFLCALTAVTLPARTTGAQTAPKATDPAPAWTPPVLLRPLQLSLAAPTFVPGARYAPLECDHDAEANGNALPGAFPAMTALGYQLSPRLSVLAF